MSKNKGILKKSGNYEMPLVAPVSMVVLTLVLPVSTVAPTLTTGEC